MSEQIQYPNRVGIYLDSQDATVLAFHGRGDMHAGVWRVAVGEQPAQLFGDFDHGGGRPGGHRDDPL